MAHVFENYRNDYHKSADMDQNLKFKMKYKKLKRLVKNTVLENAALCDQVAQMQENLVIVKAERLFLLRKLCQLQGETDIASIATKVQNNNLNTSLIDCDSGTTKRCTKKRNATDNTNSTGDSNAYKGKTKRCGKIPKRLVQLIPLDIHGRPLFPISLGDLTVYSLGEVVSDRPAYHTEELIYPVGYCSTRVYASLKNVQTTSLYTCKILDGGAKPRFEIVSDSDLNQPLVGSSPDECHSRLLAAISPLLCNVPPKGANFFGISHPTIQNLIQSSPGTRKLPLYKPQRFEVSKSLPGENDGSPIPEKETDPGINFHALHRTFALNSYRIKQEPIEHDLRVLHDLA
ncbi:hypothetical protein PV327_010046 [Microctonus hyperodae]|uniref:INO80 complex subunit E N-terminal domain-containing protein n=1 Tax=Microctonus hyperodae TaxID=165561 RepID=A0AA39KGK0_MICHY|nr:hypothetical protein PV327_010046 [Microctonus hyperodae]